MKKLLVINLVLYALIACQGQSNNDREVTSFTWTEGQSPQNAYRYHIALVAAGKLYVVGGNDDGTLESYDPVTSSWSSWQNLPTPRVFAAGAVVGDALYVLGGMDRSLQYSASATRYDLAQDTWIECKQLPSARCRFASVACDGKIYVFGGLVGRDDRNFSNSSSVEMYDPITDSWTSRADMPTPRHGHSALLVGDKILVVGGYIEGPTSIVEEYDPMQDTWATKAAMPTARGFFGLVNIDNHVYAMAGRLPNDQSPIERYDPVNDTWTRMDPMPVSRQRFGDATLDGTVYIVGGENNPHSMLIGQLKEQ